jgi:hypothetical protein
VLRRFVAEMMLERTRRRVETGSRTLLRGSKPRAALISVHSAAALGRDAEWRNRWHFWAGEVSAKQGNGLQVGLRWAFFWTQELEKRRMNTPSEDSRGDVTMFTDGNEH